MMADHGDPCDDLESTYCMNGGTCYKILSMDTLVCVCSDTYKGSRCEQIQLPIKTRSPTEEGMIAAVAVIVLLILVVLAVVIYFSCKKLRTKPKNQQSIAYGIVKPIV